MTDPYLDVEPWTLSVTFRDVRTDTIVHPESFELILERRGRAPIVHRYPDSSRIRQDGDAYVFTNDFTAAGTYQVFAISTEGVRGAGVGSITVERTPAR